MTESEYEVLRRKAREYKQMAELAIENELDEQAVENYNFALEMLMKAVLVQEGCNPPKTHDLMIISNTKDSGNRRVLRKAIFSATTVRPMWDKIHSIWSPDDRYVNLAPEGTDYSDIFEAYKRVYGWIQNKFF